MWKKCKIVMLPTNEKAIIYQSNFSKRLGKLNSIKSYPNAGEYNSLIDCSPEFQVEPKDCQSQHLYILSDEEIKEEDWFIKMNYNSSKPTVYQENKSAFMNSEWLNSSDVKDCFKIIATTDSSLTFPATNSGRYVYQLPSPSQSFIEKYVAEYNKGNVITDVLVEYEAIGNWRHAEFVHTRDIPKINPKDNTITIKKGKG